MPSMPSSQYRIINMMMVEKHPPPSFHAPNPANPLREFTIVFAPYCTADVHLGARTERFETADGKHLNIAYRGLANAQRVEFGPVRVDGATALMQVYFVGRDGSVRVFLYSLLAEAGGWRIGGVEELNRYWPRQGSAGTQV